MNSYVMGGIGDVLLSLHNIHAYDKVDLYTHSPATKTILTKYGIIVDQYQFYDSIPANIDFKSDRMLAKVPFPNIEWDCVDLDHSQLGSKYASIKPGLAIHPFGSNLSNNYWAQRQEPIKNIPPMYVDYIVSRLKHKYECVVFGSPNELSILREHMEEPVLCCPTGIWESLMLATTCCAFIGADSSIKTMTAISRIPTHVFIGDYVDDVRDQIFLEPYVKENIMHLYRYTIMHKEMFDPAIERLL